MSTGAILPGRLRPRVLHELGDEGRDGVLLCLAGRAATVRGRASRGRVAGA